MSWSVGQSFVLSINQQVNWSVGQFFLIFTDSDLMLPSFVLDYLYTLIQCIIIICTDDFVLVTLMIFVSACDLDVSELAKLM